ncbi:MAG TPA: type II secretion system protein [Candidatus Angelobacter sp.]|nr:type II secretion system protein [Candidatus Angelobacter sp.]
MKKIRRTKIGRTNLSSGFSLIEMLLVVAILTVVLAATFKQIGTAQFRYNAEGQKLDLTQQAREFIDQFTRDAHQSGYPSPAMYGNRYPLVGLSPNTHPANSNLEAAGLWFISQTDVAFEGDLDGLGNVQVIQYHYDDGTSFTGPGTNPCPCIRRSSLPKIAANPWGQNVPVFYTEIQNLIPGQDIFTAYNANGSPVTLPTGSLSTSGQPPTGGILLGNDTSGIDSHSQASLQSIKTIRINLTLQAATNDLATHQSIQVNMTGSARLPNN